MAPHGRAVYPTRGGKGDWNSFKPTAPIGETVRLESIRGGHKIAELAPLHAAK